MVHHGETTTGQRVDGENRDLQHRPHHAGADGLQHSADQYENEARTQPGEHGTDGEHRHRDQHDLTGGETAGEECGQRNHHAHHQLENRREPLAHRDGNPKIPYNRRQRGAHLQLREIADERDERKNRNGNERRTRQPIILIRLFPRKCLGYVPLR